VLIPQGTIQTRVTHTNTGYTSKKILHAWFPLGRVYEGSTTVHNIPLLHDQVKVGVEEVKDADAPVSVPTNEVNLVG